MCWWVSQIRTCAPFFPCSFAKALTSSNEETWLVKTPLLRPSNMSSISTRYLAFPGFELSCPRTATIFPLFVCRMCSLTWLIPGLPCGLSMPTHAISSGREDRPLPFPVFSLFFLCSILDTLPKHTPDDHNYFCHSFLPCWLYHHMYGKTCT